MNYQYRRRFISWLTDIDLPGFRMLAHSLPKFLIPANTRPLTMKTQYGFELEIDPERDGGLYASLYYTGTYEKGTLDILRQFLRQGDHVIDVGANIGLMSLYAATLVGDSGKVWAIEPNPNTLEILRRNCSLNQASLIEILPFALGSRAGHAQLSDSTSDRGSASLVNHDPSGETWQVELQTLDDVFTAYPKDIKLIKLDIEGYELEALKGGRRVLSTHQPALIIESSSERGNFANQNANDLFSFIQQLGFYRIYKLRGTKLRKSALVEIDDASEMPTHDNVFCLSANHRKDLGLT